MIPHLTGKGNWDMQRAIERCSEDAFEDRFGESRYAIRRIRRRLGPGVSDVLANILFVAATDGKLDDVLAILNGYCQAHMQSTNGALDTELDEQRTKVTLALIIRETLDIKDSVHTLTFRRCRPSSGPLA